VKRSDPRERILKTATKLFYERGINNVGIDLVISRSGVAKMTLYHHFKSKDELVLAFLERVQQQWTAWFTGRVNKLATDPRKRLLAVFDVLEEWFKTPDFRGCPFINTAAEVGDSRHPAHRTALRYKMGLRDYFADLASKAGVSDTVAIADSMLMLADGAIVRAAMSGDAKIARHAKTAATALLS